MKHLNVLHTKIFSRSMPLLWCSHGSTTMGICSCVFISISSSSSPGSARSHSLQESMYARVCEGVVTDSTVCHSIVFFAATIVGYRVG